MTSRPPVEGSGGFSSPAPTGSSTSDGGHGLMIHPQWAGLGREAIKEFVPIQPGDVEATWADTTLLKEAVGYAPSTPLGEGVERFARWFKGYSWR